MRAGYLLEESPDIKKNSDNSLFNAVFPVEYVDIIFSEDINIDQWRKMDQVNFCLKLKKKNYHGVCYT